MGVKFTSTGYSFKGVFKAGFAPPPPLPPSDWSSVTEQELFLASNAESDAAYGWSTALSEDGNTLAVSAPYRTLPVIYVYTRSGSTWTEEQKITISGDGRPGRALSLSDDGNTLAIAEPQSSVGGEVHVWTRSGTTWSEEEVIFSPNPESGGTFGVDVEVSGESNTLIIGANAEDVSGSFNSGRAYVFTRSGTTWTLQDTFTAIGTPVNSQLGISVSLSQSGNSAVVGVRGINSFEGRAYTYTRSGSTWTFDQELSSSFVQGTAQGAQFGSTCSMSSDGNTVIVGARYENHPSGTASNNDVGVAFIFKKDGTWTEQAALTGDIQLSAYFSEGGVSMSGDGSTVVVGATWEDVGGNTNSGAAYVFQENGGTWTRSSKITASNLAAGDFFSALPSAAISRDGTTISVGAPQSIVFGSSGNDGKAFVYIPG